MEQGSIVHLVREDTDGTVVCIDGRNVWVNTDDGFEYVVDVSDLVVRSDESLRQMLRMAGSARGAIKKSDAGGMARSASARKPKVVDLHGEKLVPDRRGLSDGDIHRIQLETIRAELDAMAGHPGCSVLFIHGKGDGVLRNELIAEVKKRGGAFSWRDSEVTQTGFLGGTVVRVG